MLVYWQIKVKRVHQKSLYDIMVSQVAWGPSFNVSLWVSSLALAYARQKLQKLWKVPVPFIKKVSWGFIHACNAQLACQCWILKAQSHLSLFCEFFFRQNRVVSIGICDWKFCVRVKDFATDFSQRVQDVHTNFPSWPTENCFVWKWLDFCVSWVIQYISKLLTMSATFDQHFTMWPHL